MKRMLVFTIGVCALVAAGAGRAEAQVGLGAFHGYLTGYAGGDVGGDVSDPVFTPGLAVSVQEDNGWGAEFDFGYAAGLTSGRQELDVATYMLNASWIQPRGGVRPFVSLGVGVVQTDGCDAPCTRPATTYDPGVNAGGGALYLVNDAIALRGEARYFRTLADHADLSRPEQLGFWRLSIGVTFLWVIVP